MLLFTFLRMATRKTEMIWLASYFLNSCYILDSVLGTTDLQMWAQPV